MQHVDDGTIHAWLDRQVTDAEEIARIETHLRECPSCHARLADERATLEQADALLAAAAPLADADRPAFETIVARAGSGGSGPADSRSVYRTWVMPVSWAASVALAAALGWAVRDRVPLNVEPQRDARPVSQSPTTQTSSSPTVTGQTQSGDTQAVASRSAAGSTSESRIPNPGSQESSRRQGSAGAGATADSRSVVGGSPAPPTVSPEQPVTATSTLRGALGESETGGAAINVIPAPPPQATPAPTVANRQEAAFTLSAEANAADAVARAPEARAAAPAPGAGGAPAGGGRGGRGGGRGGGGGGGGRGGGPAPGGGGANQGRVVVDGLAIAGGAAGATDANAWRALPRTDAAAQSGMALYGIDGLMPMATMLSMDNAVVRTIYRLESGETIELVQQKVVANNAAESVARAGPAGAVGATTASQTQTQGQGQGQGQGQLGQAQSDRPADPPQWTTMRNDVRLTLRGTANLNALGERLRLD